MCRFQVSGNRFQDYNRSEAAVIKIVTLDFHHVTPPCAGLFIYRKSRHWGRDNKHGFINESLFRFIVNICDDILHFNFRTTINKKQKTATGGCSFAWLKWLIICRTTRKTGILLQVADLSTVHTKMDLCMNQLVMLLQTPLTRCPFAAWYILFSRVFPFCCLSSFCIVNFLDGDGSIFTDDFFICSKERSKGNSCQNFWTFHELPSNLNSFVFVKKCIEPSLLNKQALIAIWWTEAVSSEKPRLKHSNTLKSLSL